MWAQRPVSTPKGEVWPQHSAASQSLISLPYPHLSVIRDQTEAICDSPSKPVEGVQARALRDTWGSARSAGRSHEGIDIFAKRGTPVLSTTEGIVTQVGTNRLGGLVVWVMGPGGQRHYYAHLDGYADVEAGMRIQPGRVLGYVGNSGNAKGTPPHLHYGVYEASGAINPYKLLRCEEVAAATSAKTAPDPKKPDCRPTQELTSAAQ